MKCKSYSYDCLTVNIAIKTSDPVFFMNTVCKRLMLFRFYTIW